MRLRRPWGLALALLARAAFVFGGPGNADAPPAEPRIVLVPAEARPGDPVAIAFVLPAANADAAPKPRAVLVARDGTRLAEAPGFSLGSDADGLPVYCAILAVPTTAAAGEASIRVEGIEGAPRSARLDLRGREFARQDVALGKENTDLRTAPDPKKTAESAALWKVLTTFDPAAAYAVGAFAPPVDSKRRTSTFGDRRSYRYADGTTDRTIHAGIDYGVPKGTTVRSAAAGRVVLARRRIVTGYTAVIEHLPGVFTLYYHLDQLFSAEGAMVAAGEVIGLSGSTGLSTGPHLHWEVRVSGEAADPDAFLARAVLDKDAVLSRIVGHYDR